MNERTSEQGETMSRKIPTATKDGAFRLWLQGHAYREIHNGTGMSLGAINQMVAEARGKIPNIEELRQLNNMLRKSDASVHDAVRGAKLLDVLNERGVGLDTLHSYIELSDRISSERGVEAERFVQSAMKLMKLEGGNWEKLWRGRQALRGKTFRSRWAGGKDRGPQGRYPEAHRC
jgi:hypothetical protein